MKQKPEYTKHLILIGSKALNQFIFYIYVDYFPIGMGALNLLIIIFFQQNQLQGNCPVLRQRGQHPFEIFMKK